MDFPIEIWRVILSHFDVESLKKCLTWSRSFQELIIKSPELMQKLPLILYEGLWRQKLWFVEKYGKYVKQLSIVSCTFINPEELRNVLTMMPNLETIVSKYSMFNELEDLLSDDFKVEKLKSLTVEYYRDPEENHARKMLSFYKNCTNLKYLKFKSNCEHRDLFLGEFIALQDKLEYLNIGGHAWNSTVTVESVFTAAFMERARFKLKTFKLFCALRYHGRLSQFLRSQSSTLEDLSLCSYEMNFHFHRLIFTGLPKLKKLGIRLASIVTDSRLEEFKHLQMPNIRHLELHQSCQDEDSFKFLLGAMPNLEVLSGHFEFVYLNGVLEKLPKLRKFVTRNSKVDNIVGVKSSSLREIEINHLNSAAHEFYWELLSSNCPNIERLVFNNLNCIRSARTLSRDVKLLLPLVKLYKNLKFFEINNTGFSVQTVNEDFDWPHESPEVIAYTSKFRVILDIKARQLSASKYLTVDHADLIKNLAEDFGINEVGHIEMTLQDFE